MGEFFVKTRVQNATGGASPVLISFKFSKIHRDDLHAMGWGKVPTRDLMLQPFESCARELQVRRSIRVSVRYLCSKVYREFLRSTYSGRGRIQTDVRIAFQDGTLHCELIEIGIKQ